MHRDTSAAPYLKSSLYNLITALKRGTRYVFLSRWVSSSSALMVVWPRVTAPMSGAGGGCWGTRRPGWSARSRGAAGRAGSRMGGPAAASRRSGSSPSLIPGAALFWRAGSETRSWPGIRENCVREEEEKSVSRPECWCFECQLYFISAPFAQIVTRSQPGSLRVWGPHWTRPAPRCWGTASPCTSSPGCWAARWWRASEAFC